MSDERPALTASGRPIIYPDIFTFEGQIVALYPAGVLHDHDWVAIWQNGEARASLREHAEELAKQIIRTQSL